MSVKDILHERVSANSGDKPLAPEEIELINAHGPFNHSVWRGRGFIFSHEEGLAGRVQFLAETVREAIRSQFGPEQIAGMSIADVGCYDGWLLESLSDLPFLRMVGIEPRLENIERGKRVREILHIPSRVDYRPGEIDTLDEREPFDIVLCMGVIHHLESIYASLKKLRSICRKMLIVETLCLPSRHLTRDLQRDVELKDVVYSYKPRVYGISAQKYESHYYPGSGVRSAVVSVPTVETMMMYMDALGLRSLKQLADWNSYKKRLTFNHRPINAFCLSGMVECEPDAEDGLDTLDTARWLEDYEARMTAVVLAEDLITPVYRAVCAGGTLRPASFAARLIHLSMSGPRWLRAGFRRLALRQQSDPTCREIVASLVHCPVDKVRLEYAKHLLARGRTGDAISELQKITQRPNADWRACYRAFYLLWRAHTANGDEPAAERSRCYCLQCNRSFPPALFEAPPPFRGASA